MATGQWPVYIKTTQNGGIDDVLRETVQMDFKYILFNFSY